MKPLRTLLAFDRRSLGKKKGATGAAPASDVRRGRLLLLAFGGATLGVAGAFALTPSIGRTGPGPLTPPHRAAGLTCETCHGKDQSDGSPAFAQRAREACQTCHGAHPSKRPGHARLMESGKLGCPTCHTIHRSQEGVRIADDGKVTRYSTEAERDLGVVGFVPDETLLIPLVSTKACLQCHTGQGNDPAARCASGPFGDGVPSMCFDEHQVATTELPALAPAVAQRPRRGGRDADLPPPRRAEDERPRGVCRDQHFADRPLAWETAREAAARVPTLTPGIASGGAMAWLFAGGTAGVLAAAALGLWQRVGRRARPAAPRHLPVAARTRKLPVIDPSACLGCYACVDVCPYGVLEVQSYVAVVARPDACCGLVLCEEKCPNGSLKVAEGEPVLDLPALDPNLMSRDVPGMYLAGDITGLPLIKNAMLQGRHAAEAALASIPAGRDAARPDLVIVGAGPAGISAALRAKELGKSAVILEQGALAESIRSFPRGKLVFDQPLELPVVGNLWLEEATKEELLMHWTRIVRREALDLREGVRMLRVAQDEGGFAVEVETEAGLGRIRAHRVLLAIGRRGTPKTLDVPIAETARSRIYYHLADAQSLDGQRVLVLGLGDAAMEAAIALCNARRRQISASPVTIVYRGATYSRGQPRNIEEVERLRKTGRIEVIFSSNVQKIDHDVATLDTGRQVPFDVVLALIGSVAPREALAHAGIQLAARPAEEPKHLTRILHQRTMGLRPRGAFEAGQATAAEKES